MKPELEVQIVRWAIIIMLISTVVGIGINEYVHLPEHEQNTISNTKSVISGFGEINLYESENVSLFSTNTYQDTPLVVCSLIPNNNITF